MENSILEIVKDSGKYGITQDLLSSKINLSNKTQITKLLTNLFEQGLIVIDGNKIYDPKSIDLFVAKITRKFKKFCFAKKIDEEISFFIPGSLSKGAIVEDIVLISKIPPKELNSPEHSNLSIEGEVKLIIKETTKNFVGTIEKFKDNFFVKCDDSLMNASFKIDKFSWHLIKEGDFVVFNFLKRGLSSFDHVCKIVENCHSSFKAINCANAILKSSGAPIEFTSKELLEAEKIASKEILVEENLNRIDLTNEIIFSIDSASSKDLDDAISIKKTDSGFLVGVHIADVSHYVEKDSILDIAAFKRGNSIYYASKVVPMLPFAISNGICSLNPNVNRLAFSALINLDLKGSILSFKFEKSIIKSKVKGIYSEINEILTSKNPSTELIEKYCEVIPSLKLMQDLFIILKNKQIERGVPQLTTIESKIELDETNSVVNVCKNSTGISEQIVEEFMLLANEAAATLSINLNLPFLYRVHEFPPEEKVEFLKEFLDHLGLQSSEIKPKLKPKVLANLIEKTKKTNLDSIINMFVLRTMAKAKYSPSSIGHYGLALKNYSHFTSPIRRYPDLLIHRILTEKLFKKTSLDEINSNFKSFVQTAAEQTTLTEKRALQLERETTSCFKAEFMRNKLGEIYDGKISAVTPNGFFVMLENSIEGYVRAISLKNQYVFDGYSKLTCLQTGHFFQIGQELKIKVASCNVSTGKVDFEIVEWFKLPFYALKLL